MGFSTVDIPKAAAKAEQTAATRAAKAAAHTTANRKNGSKQQHKQEQKQHKQQEKQQNHPSSISSNKVSTSSSKKQQKQQQRQQQRDTKAGGPNPEKVSAPKGGPEGWEPRISHFFPFSRMKFHYLCSLWASSRGISVVFSRLFFGIPVTGY